MTKTVMGGDTAEKPDQRLARWFADSDTVACVFENRDLGSTNCGHRFAMPYTKAMAEKMEIGKARPAASMMYPDWKYILVGKATSPEETMTLLDREPGA